MTQKTITRSAFAKLAGVNPSTVTRLCDTLLQRAVTGKRIDPDHPDAVAYLEHKALHGTPPPATGVDPLYQAGVDLCTTSGRWTVSNLQRKLKIGYNRASRLMAAYKTNSLVPDDTTDPVTVAPDRSHRPAPAIPPVTPQQSIDDITPEIPDDIAELADLTLREVVTRYGTLSRFSDILRALKSIEDIQEKRLKNAQTDGTLVTRKLVKIGIVDVFNSAHLRVMADGAKTIAAGVVSKHAAGADLAEIEAHVSDVLGSFFKPVKGKIERTLRNA